MLGPADVHPHQHLGPVGGVHPAGAGTDGDQRLALVVLAREQGAHLGGLDVGAQRLELGVGLGERVCRWPPFAFLGRQLVEHRQVVEALPQLLDPAQLALGVGQLTRHPLRAGLVVPQIGIGRLVFELLDAAAQTVHIEHPLHRGQGGVEGGDVGLTVGFHSRPRYRRRDPRRMLRSRSERSSV